MSDRGPTSPDDPEWVDEIVRRALERAGADDANAPAATPAAVDPAPVSTPALTDAVPASAAAVTDISPGPAPSVRDISPGPAPSVSDISPGPEPSVSDAPAAASPGPEIAAAPPVVPAPPAAEPTPVAPPTPEPVIPVTAAPRPAPGEDLFGAPADVADTARLPEVDDVISAYPLDDTRSAAEVAGAGDAGHPSVPYPDLDHDPRFDEAVGLGSDPDFEADPMGSRMRGFLEWGAVVVGALAVALIIKTFLMQAYFIPSSSMEPTLQIGDRVLVNKLSYDFGDIGRGDLVVFNRPPNQEEGEDDLIKRVIALEGETIEIDDGQVFIVVAGSSEKQLLQEPYLPEDVRTTGFVDDENCIDPTPTSCGIPDGHVFVMGDNRGGSRDSRFFGPIPEDLVVGRAFMRVWPIGDVGFL